MFTPARADTSERLRPWCVLIVVDLAAIAAPRPKPGAPLADARHSASVLARELPDLAESWAWAHTQLLTDAAVPDVPSELAQHPERNVSRLMAPRRLEPNHRYAACLVPAFDVGVIRGLGDTPADDAQAKPAWDVHAPARLILPVYFHWEFATGAAGDFESLARALTPFKVSGRVGLEKMFVGQAGDGMPVIDPASKGAYLDMDGALRAPSLSSGNTRRRSTPHCATDFSKHSTRHLASSSRAVRQPRRRSDHRCTASGTRRRTRSRRRRPHGSAT